MVVVLSILYISVVNIGMCQAINVCDRANCSNRGQCINVSNGTANFTCSCDPGYSGDLCEIGK